jgi:hypothetical protein
MERRRPCLHSARSALKPSLTVGLLPRSLPRAILSLTALDYRVRNFQSQTQGFPAKPSRRYTLQASERYEARKDL